MTLIDKYEVFLAEITEVLNREIEQLIQEDRVDEANHKKIERNVVDIFTKMFVISKKEANGDKAKLAEKFEEFFNKIPRNWYTSLEKAESNNDEEAVFIEQLKINKKDALLNKFKEMM